MGGYARVGARTIPVEQQRRFTCTTKGCPDAAAVILPQNENVLAPLAETGTWSSPLDERVQPSLSTRTSMTGQPAETRLCRRCVRTLLTGLPPGQRLLGVELRYPEVTPSAYAAEEIVGSPEYLDAQIKKPLVPPTGEKPRRRSRANRV